MKAFHTFRIDDAMWVTTIWEKFKRVKLVDRCAIGIRIKGHYKHETSMYHVSAKLIDFICHRGLVTSDFTEIAS